LTHDASTLAGKVHVAVAANVQVHVQVNAHVGAVELA
jgi:predicted membrane protein